MKSKQINKLIVLIIAIVAVLFLSYYYFRPFDDENSGDLTSMANVSRALSETHGLIESGDYTAALDLATKILDAQPESIEAMMLAGESAFRLQRFQEALDFYRRVTPENPILYLDSLLISSELLITLGHLTEAEHTLQEVLQLDTGNINAHRFLAYLMSATGRRWQAYPHYVQLTRSGAINFSELVHMSDLESAIVNNELLQKAVEASPNDADAQLGLAKNALAEKRYRDARQLAEYVIDKDRDQVEAHIVLGQVLLETNESARVPSWRANLSQEAETFPGIWFLFGRYQEAIQNSDSAIRCYWETLNRNPNHAGAAHRLGQLLIGAGKRSMGQAFLDRSDRLNEITRIAGDIANRPRTIELDKQMAELMEQLGRYPEANAWRKAILQGQPDDAESNIAVQRMRKYLIPPVSMIAEDHDLAAVYDLSSYPSPTFDRGSVVPEEQILPAHIVDEAPRFLERAADVGIEFSYFSGDNPEVPGMQLHQGLGGGVGILDYDQDGWMDVYLSQGIQTPFEIDSSNPRDRLYRNLGNGKFADVTDQAQLGSRQYGQGVAVGDINNDGFPDLTLSNIGENYLYLNLGDGTFEEISNAGGIAGKHWSTSCAVADLNDDQLPDLYFANYLAGDKPLDTQCDDGGRLRACEPSAFDAEQDRVYFNNGDGTFRDVTHANGFTAGNGRGLGLVVAKMSRSEPLSVFVANDMTNNFLFVNADPAAAKFQEVALLRGLASDIDGKAQACMGIAFDDADGDGDYDVFVTNFYNESNTLYLQSDDGLFLDETASCGLRGPSLSQLGFGTQFVDPQLDGKLDLFVANGHIDDFEYLGRGYKMYPQYFHNSGSAQFSQIPKEELGDYFDRKYLGRSVALWDWNNDGKQDMAVGHLQHPFELLSNETETDGKFLCLQLIGIGSARDAIGSQVMVKTRENKSSAEPGTTVEPGRTLVKQLAAGSGFQASNQRYLHFGMTSTEEIDSVTVEWASGKSETIRNMIPNQRYRIVEGSGAYTVGTNKKGLE